MGGDSFVGRERDVADVVRLLRRARLVTLLGPGGIGKTRLAGEVAARMRDVGDVRVVELAVLRQADLLPEAVVAGLGLPEVTAGGDAVGRVAEHLRDREMLVVLDTCEHLAEACAVFAERLLAGAPGVRVLTTSREALNTSAEHVRVVRPLPESDAVRLFEERAAAARPGTTFPDGAVAAMCRRLDGIPLAIELAAARLRDLPPDELPHRLDDRFRVLAAGRTPVPRHRALRTALDWSHDLLSPAERRLWAALSVFAGGFDLAAIRDVCTGGPVAADDLDGLLADLVGKSILQHDDGLYRMLDTLRQYGHERLEASGGRDACRRRHRDHYLRAAERFAARWTTGEQRDAVDDLDAQRANLWAALEYSYETPGEEAAGLRMATALRGFWLCTARFVEGRFFPDLTLERHPGPSRERAEALLVTHWFGMGQGAYGQAAQGLAEARALARDLRDDRLYAAASQLHAAVLTFRDDTDGALDVWTRTREAALTCGDPVVEIHSHGYGALLHAVRGDDATALALSRQAVGVFAGTGERYFQGWAHCMRALTHFLGGRGVRAAAHLRTAVRLKHDVEDPSGLASCLEMLAWVAAGEGEARGTAWLLGAAEAQWRRIGVPLFGMRALRDVHDRSAAEARAALGGDLFDELFTRGLRLPQDRVVAAAAVGAFPEPDERPGSRDEALSRLTPREREVAKLVAAGLTNREIAERFTLSKRTVDAHVEHILAKLGAPGREAVTGLVEESPLG